MRRLPLPSPHLNRRALHNSTQKLCALALLLLPGVQRFKRTGVLIMPCAGELIHGEGGTVKVGTTGTIGSLITRELEAVKASPQPAATPRVRRQGCQVSVPCGTSPRKAVLRKSSSSVTSNRTNNGRTDRVSSEDACKTRRVTRRHTFSSPILHSDGTLTDRSPNAEKAKKKGNRCGVEVVDVKCSNPMSSRLRKLGFSRLSQTFA